jgi:hypothetical protein
MSYPNKERTSFDAVDKTVAGLGSAVLLVALGYGYLTLPEAGTYNSQPIKSLSAHAENDFLRHEFFDRPSNIVFAFTAGKITAKLVEVRQSDN